MKRTITILALTVGLAGCGSAASSHKGFYNMRTLATSLTERMNFNINMDNLKDGGGIPAVSDTNCIHTGGQLADCLADMADGSSEHVSVSISANGDSWISH